METVQRFALILGAACTGVILSVSTGYAGHDQTGIFEDQTSTRLSLDTNRGVRADVGDLDGDGDVDVIVPGGAHTGSPVPLQDFLLQINDGDGVFTAEAASRLPASAFSVEAASAAILGDVDNDGDLDVFVANGTSLFILGDESGYQNRLWINDGSGIFTDETFTRLPTANHSSFHAAFGDLDGDEDLDIVVGNVLQIAPLSSQNRILINDGAGVFTDETATRLPSSFDITLAVALGDLDGDEDLDLVVANRSVGQSKILINDSSGVFTDESFTRFDRPFAGDVKIVDIDGDNDMDIMFTSIFGGPLVYVNDGTGVFANETASQTPIFSNSHGLSLADVDQDGDIDAFVVTPQNDGAHLLLNNGAGFFTDSSETNLPEIAADTIRYPACGDLDGDGDPDFYLPVSIDVPTNHQDRILINLGDPFTLIEDLIDAVADLDLSPGITTPLLSTLNAAASKLGNDNPHDDQSALGILNGFIAIVEAKIGMFDYPADAEELIAAAEDVLARLTNPADCI